MDLNSINFLSNIDDYLLGFGNLFVVLGIVLLLVRPLGGYISRVAQCQKTFLDPLLKPLESLSYRFFKIDPTYEQRWQVYTLSLLCFNLIGILFLFFLQIIQSYLPFGQGIQTTTLGALNTAVSFVTNTVWQSTPPEMTVSLFIQAAGLTVQNFLSAATGMSVALALTRSLISSKKPQNTLGNFWVDCTRMTLWVLLPLSVIFALILVALGVPQALKAGVWVTTLEGQNQLLPLGPIASEEAIKFLGSNGEGYFSANSAHPFENPTPLTNLLQTIAIILIPLSLTYSFGKMVGNTRQGTALLKAMVILLGASSIIGLTIILQNTAVWEGIETRFGHIGTMLMSIPVTSAAAGAANASFTSLSPLSGLVFLANMLTGGVIPGGVGSGLYQIILFAILAVFLAGLMVGRTPEYLGKKIEGYEIKMVVLGILMVPFAILALTSCAVKLAPDASLNSGAHALTEIFYGFTSTAFTNGSTMAGLKAHLPFYQATTIISMLVGRYVPILAVMAIAGSLIQKPSISQSAATFPTTGALFVGLLIAVILVTGGLIFFPVMVLGPIGEYVS